MTFVKDLGKHFGRSFVLICVNEKRNSESGTRQCDYQKEFAKHARFAIVFVMDEEDECRCFEKGIKDNNLDSDNGECKLVSFPKLVKIAMLDDKCLTEEE